MSQRKHELDGLRAFAVVPVVIGHAWPGLMPSGHLGVDVFFVLSGYLIAGLLWDQASAGKLSLSDFYRRRMLRLMPSFFLVLFSTLAVSWLVHLPSEMKVALQTGVYAALSASNLYLPGTTGYFSADAALNPLLHTWSLGVEEQFYLVFPLLLLLAWRFGPRALFAVIVLLALVSLWHSHGLHESGSPWAHYSPMGRAWELLLGCALALAVRMGAGRLRDRTSDLALGTIAYVALISIVCIYFFRFKGHELEAQVATALLTALVVWATSGEKPTSAWLLRLRPFVGIGLVSYALYLWHQPVMAFARLVYPEPGWGFLIGTSLVSFGLAILSRRYVEEPMRHLRMSLPRTLILLVAALGLMGLITIRAHQTDFFYDRVARMSELRMEHPEDQATAKGCSAWGPLTSPRPDFCKFAATESDRSESTVAIWGDSHAAALVAGFISLDRPYDLLHLGMSGCVITVDGLFKSSSDDCIPKHLGALERILNDPSIEVVVLHMRWAIGQSEKEFAENAFSNFDQAILKLKEAGKKVIYVSPVPGYKMAVPGTAWRSVKFGVDITPTKTLHEHLSDGGRRIHEPLEIARARGLDIYDATLALCPEGVCQSVDGFVPLYYDDDHLSVAGATRVARGLDTMIRDLLARTGQSEKASHPTN